MIHPQTKPDFNRADELVSRLQNLFGITIKQVKLIDQALTHRSYLNEVKNKTISSNERLEFLGDAILQYWVSQLIYKKYPARPEGQLTSMRTFFVRTETLYQLALSIDLGKYLHLSHGEEGDGGRQSRLLLANTLEALIGAIYLDGGLNTVGRFLENIFRPKMELINDPASLKDSKSLLQEIVQSSQNKPPTYRVIEEIGPDHDKTFRVGVYVADKMLARGSGRSKQEAEENAARLAIEKMDKLN